MAKVKLVVSALELAGTTTQTGKVRVNNVVSFKAETVRKTALGDVRSYNFFSMLSAMESKAAEKTFAVGSEHEVDLSDFTQRVSEFDSINGETGEVTRRTTIWLE